MTDKAISPLRRRMIEDMTVRGFTSSTQQGYLRVVADFTVFFGRSPDQAGPEDLRRYQLHMRSDGATATLPHTSCDKPTNPSVPLRTESGTSPRQPSAARFEAAADCHQAGIAEWYAIALIKTPKPAATTYPHIRSNRSTDPATLLLFFSGLIGLGALCWRRSKSA